MENIVIRVDPKIKTVADLEVEGYYWFADKTDPSSVWEIKYLEKDEFDEEEGGDVWYFGSKVCCDEDVEDYHVMIGPIPDLEIPVPHDRLPPVVPALSAMFTAAIKQSAKIIQLFPPNPLQVIKK